MKRLVSIFLCTICAMVQIYGQQYSASLEGNKQAGYFQLEIPQPIRSLIGNDIAKVRIWDREGRETPFVKYIATIADDKFVPLNIVRKEIIPDSVTTLIVKNEKQETWTGLWLRVANSNSRKQYTLTGSNDSLDWFSLLEDQVLENLTGHHQTFKEQEISFPLNNYKYLKISIQDKGTNPLNIMAIGRYDNVVSSTVYHTINGGKLDVGIKDKNSVLRVQLPHPQVVDKVTLHISSPRLYKRNASVFVKKRVQVRRNKVEEQFVEIGQYELRPNNTTLELPSLFVKDFYIHIENMDSPPLQVDNFSLGQKPLTLVTHLSEGEQYAIVVDSSFKLPDYDLALFKLQANHELPILKVNKLTRVEPQLKDAQQDEQRGKLGNILLWGGLIIAVVLVCYFAISLFRDIERK